MKITPAWILWPRQIRLWALLPLCLAPDLSFGQAKDVPPAGDAAPAVRYTEIARKVRHFQDHTVTIIKVQPPPLSAAPKPRPAPEPSAADLILIARRAAKTFETLTMHATVYLGQKRTLTELTWTVDERQYRAFSNVDFRLLTQLTDIETETAVFSWFLFVGAVDAEPEGARHATALAQLAASGRNADYLIEDSEQTPKVATATLDALDYLHAYYQLNQDELLLHWKKREAEAEENERKRAETPPPSPVIRYWPGPVKKR